jgi:hypothetical protein
MVVNKKTKESVIQSQIISYLKTRKILHNRVNNGQFFINEHTTDKYGRKRNKKRAVRCNTINGIPDIEVFCFVEINGNHLPLIVYLEVKNQNGRQSKYQKLFENRIKSVGGYYFVVRGVNDVVLAFDSVSKDIKTRFGKDAKFGFVKAFSLPELGGANVK